MRIIAGTVGGRKLLAPKGASTRPTAERVREAIFSILLARGASPERVLDLYAGTGALGLEALSRGARRCVLVDEDEQVCELIRKNADALGLADRCRIDRAPVLKWLRKPPVGEAYDWIFLDPPYALVETGELDKALGWISEAGMLRAGGLAVAEHEWRRAPADEQGTIALLDRRRYGQTSVSIYGGAS